MGRLSIPSKFELTSANRSQNGFIQVKQRQVKSLKMSDCRALSPKETMVRQNKRSKVCECLWGQGWAGWASFTIICTIVKYSLPVT